MEEECDNIEKRILFNTAMKEALQLEVVKQRGKLEEGWREDEEMEKEFAERDKLFLDDITDLQKRTDEREQKVSDITDKLQDELFLLASFLENVASRRPPESRHGDRPNTASNAPTVFRDYLDSRRLDKSSKDNLKKVRDELKASVNETLGLVKTDGAGDCQ
ncbi:uncharacterized protein LOC102804671 [Saccoglossus kowalevskii]|uniref:Uncharacterized protein LOC102804671 n=1 Tax=Saccoglossus kowalevskii TaxID=10224 RepID=A0ABM0MKD5_SACKO|nr:PREDICTED: uncharacterized protein LOC102804671 [Saccoglossus kowalevskii]